jgi:Fe-S-cluster containining protein
MMTGFLDLCSRVSLKHKPQRHTDTEETVLKEDLKDRRVKPNEGMSVGQKGPRTQCIRCGTCCMKGGPTLHQEDASLFTKGILDETRVYTLRKGELVRNVDESLMALEHEMIKIKGQGKSWTCMFYDEDQKACTIYEHRPLECHALKCWDLRDLEKAMARPRLERKDLIDSKDGILKIIEAHEERCAYEILRLAVEELQGPEPERAVEKILDLLQYDHCIRPLITEKLQIPADLLDFFLGRALTFTICMFGLCVKREGDSFVLAPLESHALRS